LEKHYAATVARFKLPPLLQHLKMKNNIMLWKLQQQWFTNRKLLLPNLSPYE
jgi:hypothetical protein